MKVKGFLTQNKKQMNVEQVMKEVVKNAIEKVKETNGKPLKEALKYSVDFDQLKSSLMIESPRSSREPGEKRLNSGGVN